MYGVLTVFTGLKSFVGVLANFGATGTREGQCSEEKAHSGELFFSGLDERAASRRHIHGSSHSGFGKHSGDSGVVGPNTSVGGKFSIDDALVHSDSGTGEAHPVGHGRSKERSAIRDSVLSDVSIGVHRFARGIENAAVEVGALLSNLLDNAIISCRCSILRTSA